MVEEEQFGMDQKVENNFKIVLQQQMDEIGSAITADTNMITAKRNLLSSSILIYNLKTISSNISRNVLNLPAVIKVAQIDTR